MLIVSRWPFTFRLTDSVPGGGSSGRNPTVFASVAAGDRAAAEAAVPGEAGSVSRGSSLVLTQEKGENWLSLTELGAYASQTLQGEAGVALPYGLTSVHPSGQERPAFQSPQRTGAMSPG